MSALFRITLGQATVEVELSRKEVTAVRRVALRLAAVGAPAASIVRVPPRERRQLTAEQSASVDAQMAQMSWGDGDGLI